MHQQSIGFGNDPDPPDAIRPGNVLTVPDDPKLVQYTSFGSVARSWTYSFGERVCLAVNLRRERGACIVFATILDQWTLPEHQCEHALLRQAREREPLAQAFPRERLVSKSLVKVRSWHF